MLEEIQADYGDTFIYTFPDDGEDTGDDETTSDNTTFNPQPFLTEPRTSTPTETQPASTDVDSDIMQPTSVPKTVSTTPTISGRPLVASVPAEVSESLTGIIITLAATIAAAVSIVLYLG